MKKIKSVIAIAIAICLVAVCVPLLASADTSVTFEVAFVDDSGEAIESVKTGGVFWAQIKLSDYQTVGENSGDEYNRAIAHAFLYLDVEGAELSTVAIEDTEYVHVTSPFINEIAANNGAINADVVDGVVSIGFEASAETGAYGITKDDLTANDDDFINVRMVATADDEISVNVKSESTVSLVTTDAEDNYDVEEVSTSVSPAVTLPIANDVSQGEEKTLAGAALVLEDNVSVNFYLAPEVEEPAENLAMVVGEEQYDAQRDADDNVYFVYDDISPAFLGEKIDAKIINKNTSEVLETVSYSPEQYCYSMLYKTDDQLGSIGVANVDEFRTMLVDMLYYSEGARKYFELDDLTPVTEGLDLNPSLKSYATTGDLALSYDRVLTANDGNVKWVSAGLELSRSVSIRFKVQLADGINAKNLKLYANGKQANKFEITRIADNNYYIYYRDLNPSQMRDAVTFTVYDGDQAVSTDITYSVVSYAWNAITNKPDKAALCEMVTAMIRHGDSTKNYTNTLS